MIFCVVLTSKTVIVSTRSVMTHAVCNDFHQNQMNGFRFLNLLNRAEHVNSTGPFFVINETSQGGATWCKVFHNKFFWAFIFCVCSLKCQQIVKVDIKENATLRPKTCTSQQTSRWTRNGTLVLSGSRWHPSKKKHLMNRVRIYVEQPYTD